MIFDTRAGVEKWYTHQTPSKADSLLPTLYKERTDIGRRKSVQDLMWLFMPEMADGRRGGLKSVARKGWGSSPSLVLKLRLFFPANVSVWEWQFGIRA